MLKINGLSIISHVYKKAQEADIGDVVVATEDQEIVKDVRKNGGEAILTSNNHKTGTDRIFEAFKKLNDKKISFDLESSDMTYLLKNSDFVSLHVPAQNNYVIGKNEFNLMKKGAGLINAARGGVIDEKSLIESLDSGRLAFAGIDTFENEPKPSVKLLMHPKVSLTPHIGAATSEAQDRIGIELANQIMTLVKE